MYELSEWTVDTKCASLDSWDQNHIKTKIFSTSVLKKMAFLASAMCVCLFNFNFSLSRCVLSMTEFLTSRNSALLSQLL